MELFALIWLGFAVVTGIAATARNRSFLPWLCVGAVFGAFGLIAVLVLRPQVEGHKGL